MRDGPLQGFDEHGHLVYVGGYKNGAWHGSFSGFGEDGQLLGKFKMVSGTGPFRNWHKNGKLAQQGQYKRGKKMGPWFAWYPSGKKSLEGRYENGVASGLFRWWSTEGVLLSEVRYDKGRVHGLAKTFDGAGELVEENEYDHGARIRVTRYEAGVVVERETFARPTAPTGPAITRGHPLVDVRWQSCAADQDCYLVPLTCCPCGAAEYVGTNEAGVAEAKLALEHQAACARTQCPTENSREPGKKCARASARCDDGRCVTTE